MASMRSRAMLRVTSTISSTAVGPKNGSSKRRASVWNGGSEVIGGAVSSPTPSGVGATAMSRELKFSVS